MVEHRTPNLQVLGSVPTGGTVFCHGAKHINSPEYWLIPQEYWLIPRNLRWLRPDKTEKMLSGTLNLKPSKHILVIELKAKLAGLRITFEPLREKTND